jgi:hypothetical protein
MYIFSYIAELLKLSSSSTHTNESIKNENTDEYKLEEGTYFKKPSAYKNINSSSYKFFSK